MKWEIVCTGIGGRGVLLASAVLIETAISAGYNAMASDELGMSQRGGSVVSLVKVGTFRSPFVGRENADVILSFEESEFYRNLSFLKQGGLAIVNSRRNDYPRLSMHCWPREKARCFLVNADEIARRAGSIQASNMAMLGFFSHFAIGPYSITNIVGALERKIAPRLYAMNKAVCEAGRRRGPTMVMKTEVSSLEQR